MLILYAVSTKIVDSLTNSCRKMRHLCVNYNCSLCSGELDNTRTHNLVEEMESSEMLYIRNLIHILSFPILLDKLKGVRSCLAGADVEDQLIV